MERLKHDSILICKISVVDPDPYSGAFCIRIHIPYTNQDPD